MPGFWAGREAMRKALRRSAWVVLSAACLVVLGGVWIAVPPSYEVIELPEGKRFAFTILDDTDLATLEKVKPVYDLLNDLGFRTTKTTWVLPTNKPEDSNVGETLDDAAYRDWLLQIQGQGFEIASHGARGGISTREEILDAMRIFDSVFGHDPVIHVNHFFNPDNLYWGRQRLTVPPLRLLYGMHPSTRDFFGQDSTSEYFWGDYVRDNVQYVVSFSFSDLNVLKKNPRMPYHLHQTPYVPWWFHTADGGNVGSFNRLMTPDNLDRLEKEGGVSIVYTHFAAGFVQNGELDSVFVARMTDLSERDGWFVPAGDILDYLRDREGRGDLSFRERWRLETIWFLEKLRTGRT
jgi:hypothetical protein